MVQVLCSHLKSSSCGLSPEPVDAIWVIQRRLPGRILHLPAVLGLGFAFLVCEGLGWSPVPILNPSHSVCCSLWTHKVSLEGPAEKDKDTVALHWGTWGSCPVGSI